MLGWVAVAAAQVVIQVDAPDEAALRGAFAASWPDAPVEVAVGEGTTDGLAYRAGELSWRREGVVVRAQGGLDPTTAVLLARSWLASSEALGGDAPEIPFDEPDLEPIGPLRPPRPPPGAPSRTWVGAGADVAIGATSPAVRAGGGWLGDPIEVDVTFAVALEGPSALSAAERDDPRSVGERVVRVAALDVGGWWDLGVARASGRLSGAPLLGLGVEVGPTTRRGVDPGPPVTAAVEASHVGGSLVGSAGAEVWAGAWTALRVTASARTTALGIDGWGSAMLIVRGRAKDPRPP